MRSRTGGRTSTCRGRCSWGGAYALIAAAAIALAASPASAHKIKVLVDSRVTHHDTIVVLPRAKWHTDLITPPARKHRVTARAAYHHTCSTNRNWFLANGIWHRFIGQRRDPVRLFRYYQWFWVGTTHTYSVICG